MALLEWVHWRWTFVIFGAVGVVWSVAWFWWFRDDPHSHHRVNAAELRVSGGIALLLGLVVFVQAWLLGRGQTGSISAVAIAIAVAMLAQVLSAAVFGACVPLLVKSLRGDPALLSVPAVTATCDLSGAAIYLAVITALL